MSNINLYQTGDEKQEKQRKHLLFNGGFVFSVSIFLIVLFVLGGAKLVSSNFEKKASILKTELREASATFTGDDINRIVDFDTRVYEAIENISSKPDTTKIFSEIENVMIENVKATKIQYESKDGVIAISAYLMANNFEDIAKQILSFKLNERFSAVWASDIVNEEEGTTFLIKTSFK